MQKPIENPSGAEGGERIAKRIARAGLCSRRQAEAWIAEGRVKVNGKTLSTPAVVVTIADRIEVDGNHLPSAERTRLWLYHKPAGLVTTNRDPEGRPTVFDKLPDHLPRVLTIGRLDISTEGLLLLTNDGGLARVLELPDTGWLRRYRVRAHGRVTQDQLDRLKEGIAVEGVLYGSIEASIDREQGSNVWIQMGLREGKNREIKKVLGALGLEVNRLIRISYGPFQLGDLERGQVREIRGRTLRDQLGDRLIQTAGADFDAPIVNSGSAEAGPTGTSVQSGKPAKTQTARNTNKDKHKKKAAPLDRLQTRKQTQGVQSEDNRKKDGKGAFPNRGRKRKPNAKPAGRNQHNADRRR